MIAELAEIDSLPCAEVETAVGYRDSYADAKKRTLGMSRHVVRPFHGMLIVWLPLLDDVIEDGFHVGTYIRIVILIDSESA